jgi:hypothetical protein
LSRGEYTLDELLEKKESRVIGEYLESPVSIARGPFGWYVAYKETKMGCKTLLASMERPGKVEADEGEVDEGYKKKG